MVRRVFLAFLVFGMVGCSDFGPFSVNVDDIVGTYELQSIDGEALPVVWSQVGAPILVEITAGNLVLNRDRTCSYSRTYRRTEDGIVTTEPVTTACTYAMFDSKSFWLDSGWYGEIRGSTITISDDEGELGVFRR